MLDRPLTHEWHQLGNRRCDLLLSHLQLLLLYFCCTHAHTVCALSLLSFRGSVVVRGEKMDIRAKLFSRNFLSAVAHRAAGGHLPEPFHRRSWCHSQRQSDSRQSGVVIFIKTTHQFIRIGSTCRTSQRSLKAGCQCQVGIEVVVT